MESILGLLMVIGLIFFAFVVMFRQGRNVLGCLGSMLGGAAKSTVGCIGTVLLLVLVGRFLVSGLLGGCRPANPPPDVSLTIAPSPPVETGTRLTLTASSSADIAQYSFTVKNEQGGLSQLPAESDPATREWTPTRAGNYLILVSAQSKKGATAEVRRDCYVAPGKLSAPCDDFPPENLPARQRFGGAWFGGKKHNGVDLLWGRTDRPRVLAIADGTVKYVGVFDRTDPWGQLVLIEHQYQGQSLVAVYGHIIPNKELKDRSGVTRGDIVGWVDPDMYGPDRCSGPHLHFGLFKGTYDDLPSQGRGAMWPGEFPGGWVDPLTLLAAQ